MAPRHTPFSVGKWSVELTPVPIPDDFPLVLADLAAERTVAVGENGRLTHWHECPVLPQEHLPGTNILRPTDRSYWIEFEYPERERGPAGPIHPRVRVVQPEISHRTVPQHPHMHKTRDGLDSWACAVAPHQTDWSWRNGGAVVYLDQISIWILKSAVWLTTGGGSLTSAAWIGPDSSHEPATVLTSIDLPGPCRCGSGERFANCHRAADIGDLLRMRPARS